MTGSESRLLFVSWDTFGSGESEEVVRDFAQIEQRIRALDGENRTLVTVFDDGDGHLACGGSSKSGLVLYVTFDNLTFYQLSRDSGGGGEVTVVAGGQPGGYLQKYVVDVDYALEAVKCYLRDATLLPSATWDEQ